MELTLLTGTEAIGLASSEAFQLKWVRLHARCPWATACQHPDFVLPWYRLYQARFLPIVVLEQARDGDLVSLLTLAREAGARAITGAGAAQAEYHGWLAGSGRDAFAGAAIRQVQAAFPGADIHLRYLPPDIPLDWLEQPTCTGRQGALPPAPVHRFHYALRSHPRPVMRIDPTAAARQRNKKNHRQNHNRLSRMGIVACTQLDDQESFLRFFDEVCEQYDFRQGALYHRLPFRDDPLKKPFYTDLYRRGLLHVTVLTVGGVLAAAHVGLLSAGRAVHLGINTHAPAFAAHSPGNLLLAMLGVRLAEQAMPLFDLTPGGDAYKEHFATDHDTVSELIVYNGGAQRLAREALAGAGRLARQGLRAAGYRGADVLQALDVLRSVVRCERLRGRALAGGERSACRRYRLRCSPEPARCGPDALPVAKDSLAAVLDYDARSSPLGYWQFLRSAAQRMERANHLYSLARDGKLLVFCWMAAQPSGAIRLFDLYVHPELPRGNVLQGFIEQVLLDLRTADGAGQGAAPLHCDCKLDPEQHLLFGASGFAEEPGPAAPAPRRLRLSRPWEQRP